MGLGCGFFMAKIGLSDGILSFEIKSTFDDEALTILFEVIDIQGQWILEDIVLNSEVLAFKGRKVLFQFVESHSRQMLAHDHYFYF